VFAEPAIRIVYTDGSCLNCQFGAASRPAFEASGRAISFITHRSVSVDKIDGNRTLTDLAGGVGDGVWSAGGKLAVVQAGVLWAGRRGHLARLARAIEPSWSPRGATIAASEHGWIVVIGVRDHRVRRLVRGSSPAFSPDGRWIAYVAPNHRLMIVRATGRPAPRPVGRLRAVAVDWQARPRTLHRACAAPSGSRVLASTNAAVVTVDGVPPRSLDFTNAPPIAYMGCLRADGRERLLERITGNNVDNARFVESATLAAPYAGLLLESIDEHYGGESQALEIFDLRTGQRQPKLGGEGSGCPGFEQQGVPCWIDQVRLGSDGVSATHAEWLDPVGALSTPLNQVTCAPGTTTCLALAIYGDVFSSSDPAGGAGTWTAATVGTQTSSPTTIACPSATLCLGAGPDRLYTSSNPTAGGPSWTTTALSPSAYANAMSCPSSSLCVVARINGTLAASANPTSGTSAWSIADVDPGRSLNAIFCSAEPRCFVIDSAGTVFTSANPSGGSGAWTKSPSTPPFTAGSCPTITFCAALVGPSIATTTAPATGVWSSHATAHDLDAIACPSASLCVAVGAEGTLATSADPGAGTWTYGMIDRGRQLVAVACPSVSLCVASDGTGHVVTSTNPAGGPSTWQPALIDGDPCNDTTPCSIEQVDVSDGAGLRTIDSSTISGNGPYLTALTLTGDVLSWDHHGSPRSTTLTRP
jgi:hypothetical protein